MFGKGAKTDIEQSSDSSDANVGAPLAKPTRFQRWKAHMKKWWWAYVIGFICIVLVVLLPLDYVNKYEYDYDGLSITNPTPNSLHVSQSQSISMGGGFSGSGHLSPFNASISVEGSDEPFAIFPVPRVNFAGGADFKIDQDMELLCPSCLSEIAKAAASNRDFSVVVTGDPWLKVGALPNAHLNINKKMTMDGYNVQEFVNEPGAFNVTRLDFDTSSNVKGYNVNATVAFHNPTPFVVEMGTVTFNLTVGGSPIGYVLMPNLTLQHNEKNVTETTVLGDIDAQALIKEGLWGDSNDGFATVSIGIHGDRVEYKGQVIPYYTAAIRAINATVKIDLLEYASDIL
ncbi:hypothetical protein FE257_008989 [Aspergillus nanangensis]|uniref:Uncharacterized protein n=1 Tax=Aspergillus nanangensis TaxID=2582783 RepID=A0AAD4CYG1_ASPNN|nr:hypothetical protein FE257_008989 [Aspergillus nanangensis]